MKRQLTWVLCFCLKMFRNLIRFLKAAMSSILRTSSLWLISCQQPFCSNTLMPLLYNSCSLFWKNTSTILKMLYLSKSSQTSFLMMSVRGWIFSSLHKPKQLRTSSLRIWCLYPQRQLITFSKSFKEYFMLTRYSSALTLNRSLKQSEYCLRQLLWSPRIFSELYLILTSELVPSLKNSSNLEFLTPLLKQGSYKSTDIGLELSNITTQGQTQLPGVPVRTKQYNMQGSNQVPNQSSSQVVGLELLTRSQVIRVRDLHRNQPHLQAIGYLKCLRKLADACPHSSEALQLSGKVGNLLVSLDLIEEGVLYYKAIYELDIVLRITSEYGFSFEYLMQLGDYFLDGGVRDGMLLYTKAFESTPDFKKKSEAMNRVIVAEANIHLSSKAKVTTAQRLHSLEATIAQTLATLEEYRKSQDVVIDENKSIGTKLHTMHDKMVAVERLIKINRIMAK